jgi:Mn2+/Fe2+ NRAMP family transporter
MKLSGNNFSVMLSKLKQDNLYAGLFWGFICVAVSFAIIFMIKEYVGYPYQYNFLQSPKPEVVLLAINVLIFRFVMLSFKKFETGKGMLLVFFLTTVLYLVTHRYIL